MPDIVPDVVENCYTKSETRHVYFLVWSLLVTGAFQANECGKQVECHVKVYVWVLRVWGTITRV